MLETKMNDPVPVLVTEKSLSESLKQTLPGSLETAMLFIDLTSTNVDGQGICKTKSGNVNIIEDIPTLTVEDSDLENYFPTFYSHKCVSLM